MAKYHRAFGARLDEAPWPRGPALPLQDRRRGGRDGRRDTGFGVAACSAGAASATTGVVKALEYGVVGINEGHISTEIAPFSGTKENGIGPIGSSLGLEIRRRPVTLAGARGRKDRASPRPCAASALTGRIGPRCSGRAIVKGPPPSRDIRPVGRTRRRLASGYLRAC